MVIEKIQVQYVDNELYIIASTGAGSSELCHVKSGYYKINPLTIYPGAILPELPAEQSYDITLIGINWGGPSKFIIKFIREDGSEENREFNPETEDIGCVWHEKISGVNVKTPKI
jgi:hypothetical protein